MTEVGSSSWKEVAAVAATLLRYGIAERMAQRVRDEKPIGLDMAGFVLADVLDGAVFRKFNVDTPKRRVADSITDQASVARVAYEVAKKNPSARSYIAILAARTAYSGVLNAYHQLQTGEVTKGGSRQKVLSVATALFGAAAASGNKTLTHVTGAAAAFIAVESLPSHQKDLGINHDSGIREL